MAAAAMSGERVLWIVRFLKRGWGDFVPCHGLFTGLLDFTSRIP